MPDKERKEIEASMPVGAVFGNVGSYSFRCAVIDDTLREMDHVSFEHPTCKEVLGIVSSIELQSDMGRNEAASSVYRKKAPPAWTGVAKIDVIGFRDNNSNLSRPLTPVPPSTKVFRASRTFLSSVLGLDIPRENGAYLGKVLNSDVDVVLDPEILIQKHVSIIAKTGAGKSYACGVLIEELAKHEIPILIIDPHGEYSSMISPNIDPEEYRRMGRFGIDPKGLGARIAEFSIGAGSGATPLGLDPRAFRPEEFLELIGIKPVGPNASILYNAYRKLKEVLQEDWDLSDLLSVVEADPNIGKWAIASGLQHMASMPMFSSPRTPLGEIVKKGRTSIVDLKEAPLDVQQIGVAALMKRLFQARKEGVIPPFMLVVEEAQNFCPQGSSTITSEVMRSIASEGRKFGLGLCVLTQRPARIDKSVLSQCGTQIILKVTNPNDLKAVISSVEGLDPRMSDEIQMLPVGQAIMVGGGIAFPLILDIRTRHTRHGGDCVKFLPERN